MKDFDAALLLIVGSFVVVALFFGVIKGVSSSFKATKPRQKVDYSEMMKAHREKMDQIKRDENTFSSIDATDAQRDQRLLIDENRRKQEDAQRALRQKMQDYRNKTR